MIFAQPSHMHTNSLIHIPLDLVATWSAWEELDLPGQPIRQFATQREASGVLVVYQSDDMRLWVARVEG